MVSIGTAGRCCRGYILLLLVAMIQLQVWRLRLSSTLLVPRAVRLFSPSLCRERYDGYGRPWPRSLSRASTSAESTAQAVLIADVVCNDEGDVRLQIPAVPGMKAPRFFDRARNEAISKTLKRMRISLEKAGLPIQADEEVDVALLKGSGERLDGSTELWKAFVACQAVWLLIGAWRFAIRVNKPEVLSLKVHGRPMVGFPLLPKAVGFNCTAEDMAWKWWCRAADGSTSVVSDKRMYEPAASDVGATLFVEAKPPVRLLEVEGDALVDQAEDSGWQTAEVGVVDASLENVDVGYAGVRCEAMAVAASSSAAVGAPGSSFRVISYNVLADAYRHCWDEIFHHYCEQSYTASDYRLQVARKEIASYKGDIICMQEVDAKFFKDYWEPHFECLGYRGKHTVKVSGSEEGCALFVREAAFEVVQLHEMHLAKAPEALAERGSSIAAEIKAFLASMPGLTSVWNRLGTIAQTALLKCKASNRSLVVCNSHLYFAGLAKTIRILQTALVLEKAHEVAEAAAVELGYTPSVILCGDLNSVPESGAVEFLEKKEISAMHGDWVAGSCFRWGFASSKAAASALLEMVTLDDPEAAWRAYAEELRGDVSLQALLERRRRMGISLEILENRHWEPALDAVPLGTLAERLRSGATYKTDAQIASVQLAIDALLPELCTGLTAAQLSQVKAAIEQLDSQLSLAFEDAMATQMRAAETSSDFLSATTAAGIARTVGKGLDMRHHFDFASAYDPAPVATNFVDGYCATLDWIFFDKNRLTTRAVAQVPPLSVLEEAKALPSWRFPSDHILLAADLAWSQDEPDLS
eukprot:TRINITY_DN32916_c0_g1_i2.p1 TRINITY_DN32916_c0_g1~~TRINITY_DN32916_c0_g1_i2.p1  ORF type:complete len:811 (-),score=162.90 TRINITY_DN32916_c0_g1_i2:11-2443(-)